MDTKIQFMNKNLKKTFVILGLMMLITSSTFAQQISLFDRNGEARAYIDFGRNTTIFMWDGTPVAFLERAGRNFGVIGFNGQFLGWYNMELGIMYDRRGNVVGARRGAINMAERPERAKGAQRAMPARPATPAAPAQPVFNNRWSNLSLTEFLHIGRR